MKFVRGSHSQLLPHKTLGTYEGSTFDGKKLKAEAGLSISDGDAVGGGVGGASASPGAS